MAFTDSFAWPDHFFSARRLSIKIISACSFFEQALIILIDKRRAEKKRSGHARLPLQSLSVCKNNRKIMEEYGIMELFRADTDSNQMRAVDGKQRIYLEWP